MTFPFEKHIAFRSLPRTFLSTDPLSAARANAVCGISYREHSPYKNKQHRRCRDVKVKILNRELFRINEIHGSLIDANL